MEIYLINYGYVLMAVATFESNGIQSKVKAIVDPQSEAVIRFRNGEKQMLLDLMTYTGPTNEELKEFYHERQMDRVRDLITTMKESLN